MSLSNNLIGQVDKPVWEWSRFSPVSSSALSNLTSPASNGRYMYYVSRDSLFRYDTWGDSWQQLSNIPAATGSVNIKYDDGQGYKGAVVSAPSSNTLRIGSTGGSSLVGYTIRIVAGTGVGQERTITATSEEVIHDSGLVTTVNDTTLTDNLKRWKINQWKGYSARVIFNTGYSQYRNIIYNDNSSLTLYDSDYDGRDFMMAPLSNLSPYGSPVTIAGDQADFAIVTQDITVSSAWSITPDATSKFEILSGGIWWITQDTIAASPFFKFAYYDLLSDRFIPKVTPTGLFSAALSTDFRLTVTGEQVGNLLNSIATSAGSQSLSDSSLSMTPGEYTNFVVKIIRGVGVGQQRRIISNTADTLTLSTKWDTVPVSGSSRYVVTGEKTVNLSGNARAQLLRYYPNSSIWTTGPIVDDGTPSNMVVTTQNGYNFAVADASRVINGMTAVNAVPTNAGTGYTQGDLLDVTEGTFGRVYVESVSPIGEVLSVSLYSAGNGYTTGAGIATTGGSGTGCTINISSVDVVGLITTAINHDLQFGQSVTFKGAREDAWNTVYTVIGIQTPNTIEVALTATQNAVAQNTMNTTVLVDATKNWTPGEHAGRMLMLQSNALNGNIQYRRILFNTENTLTFVIGTAPTNGNSRYAIQDLYSFGRDAAYLEDQEIGEGYSTSGSWATLLDNTKNWTPGSYTNANISLLNKDGKVIGRDTITQNTTSSLTVGRIVAIGRQNSTSKGIISYSNDGGFTWVTASLAANIFPDSDSGGFQTIAYNGTRFVAGGFSYTFADFKLAYSSDGITWTGASSTVFDYGVSEITFNGNRWVAGGGSQLNRAAWSNDGITWTVSTGATTTIQALSMKWVPFVNMWFMLNSFGFGSLKMAISTDNGISFSNSGVTVFNFSWSNLVDNGKIIIAVSNGSSNNTIAWSKDGITWNGLGTSFGALDKILWNGTQFVAWSTDSRYNNQWLSNDGINWVSQSISGPKPNALWTNRSKSIGSHYIDLFYTGSQQYIITSKDGISWSVQGSDMSNGGDLFFQSIATTYIAEQTPPSFGDLTGSIRYKIHDSYGSVTSGTTTTLVDSNKRWKVNQWAGKRVLVTSGTGFQQELTVTSNTVTQLSFGTATAPDSTSTYTILGRPAVGAGIGFEWAYGLTNTSEKGRYFIASRGGGSHTFDYYDLRTDRWTYGNYLLGQGDTLTTGTMYTYDGADRLYFTKDATARISFLDISKKALRPLCTIPYGQGTAILGNRMESVTTSTGLKYLYVMRHSTDEMWRTTIPT